jgi:arabinose-5-phosphate isomerase
LSEDQIIEKGRQVIKIESEAVAALSSKIDKEFVNAVNIIYESKGRVILAGIGKSGLIARKIVATMNSTGTPAIFLHPTDALHGDLGMVRKEDVVILISKSGNTQELVDLIPMLKRMDIQLIAMVGNKNSELAKSGDIVIDISVKEEACPYDLAPTASTTATLAMGDALAVALITRRGFSPDDFALLHPGGSLGIRLSLKISEIMIKDKDMPIVNVNTLLKDAIYEITSKRLGSTAVVDENNMLVGIITDGDLRRLLEKSLDIKQLTAKEIMTANPKTLDKDTLASFALHKMENHKITSIVVVNENKNPIGFVHLHDLVKLGLQTR